MASTGLPVDHPVRAGTTLRRLLSAAFIAAALGFVGLTIVRHWTEIRTHPWDPNWAMLALSTVGLVAVLGWGVIVWGRVLRHFDGTKPGTPILARIWFLSSIARYIPGKIWQFVAAGRMAQRAGISAAVLLTSLVVYMGFGMLSAGIASVATLPPSRLLGERGADIPAVAIAAAAGVLALALATPQVINFFLRLVPRALHRDVLEWTGSAGDGLRILVLSLIYWTFYAVAFFLFVDALVDIPLSSLPTIGGINALSFLIGYLVFVVPAGLGFREGAITVLLAPLVGGEGLAAALAVLSRLWIIAAELLGAGALLLLTSSGFPPAVALREFVGGLRTGGDS